MTESAPLVQFPVPSQFTLVLLGIGFTALLFAAVGHEVYQRRQGVRARRASEWRSIRSILKERGIDPEGVALLEKLIKNYSYLEPLQAITTRDGFGYCVEQEMAGAESGDARAYESLGLQLRGLRVELGLDYVPIGQQIHSTRELHEGQWISVSRVSDEKAKWARVMVEDVTEAWLTVTLKETPATESEGMATGMRVRCRLWREEDARYVFETLVAERAEPPESWRLRHTSELKRTQAREYFRIRHDQQINVGVVSAPAEDSEEGAAGRPVVTRLQGRVTSLSAGGCAVVVKQPVARQVVLRLPLELPDESVLDADGKIIASATISGGRYLLRIRFTGLSEEDSDRIAKHVVHRQQQRLLEKQQSE